MKKILFTPVLFLMCLTAMAQQNTDSLAYQLQRKKINAMLALRAQKFGQYDQSLSMHTGIFGLQTKKDIRRSNEILMDIVKTDNGIYKEIKILLDYRTFQQTQVQTQAKQTEQYNVGFMTTINKLQQQVDQLKTEAKDQNQQYEKTRRNFIVAVIVLLAMLVILITRTRRRA